MSHRYPLVAIRCPACDSSFTVRTSEYFETQICLNCDRKWTTKGVAAPQEALSAAAARAASARAIIASLQKTPPPQKMSAVFAKARKQADTSKRAPKKPHR
jgi:hypothetical protein